MAREGYRLWFGKCNHFNLHGVFSRDKHSPLGVSVIFSMCFASSARMWAK